MASYLLWQLQAMFFTFVLAGVGVVIAGWAESSFRWRPSLKSAHVLNAGLVTLCVAVVVALPWFSLEGDERIAPREISAVASLPALEVAKLSPRAGSVEFVVPVSPSSPLYADSARILAFALLAATLYRWARALRELHALRKLLRGAWLLKSRGGVRVWVSEKIAGPFAFAGLRHAHVMLPAAWLTEAGSLAWARRHEFQHIRQGDVQRAYVWAWLRILVPVAPWIGVWERSLGTLEEYLCDEAASRSVAGAQAVCTLVDRYICKIFSGRQRRCARPGHYQRRENLKEESTYVIKNQNGFGDLGSGVGRSGPVARGRPACGRRSASSGAAA